MLNFPIPIILASKSPRRQQLLAQMQLMFKVEVKESDEWYPDDLTPKEVAMYIAHDKIAPFKEIYASQNFLIITADTIVTVGNQILGKPKDAADAKSMLELLSGKSHEVITGVCLYHKRDEKLFFESTIVTFKHLTDSEIDFYVENFAPYDKAGAYGIQDWIGAIAVKKIEGSYTNVMGLPTERLYQELMTFNV